MHLCIDCRTPVNTLNAVLCKYCATDLETLFVRVDEVLAELAVTKNRQDVGAEVNGGAGTKLVAPAPINLTALECELAVHKALMVWALRLLQDRLEAWQETVESNHRVWVAGELVGPPFRPVKPVLPGRSTHHLSNYLMGRLPYLTTQAWAARIKPDLTKLLNRCVEASERATPRIFAGTCPEDVGGVECGTYVYEPAGTVTARCKVCGCSWDITEWTGRALISKEYVIGYPPALSRMLSSGGVKVTEQDIRNWAARGTIKRANPIEDDKGNPLRAMFRLGDVMDAWQEHTNRKQDAA